MSVAFWYWLRGYEVLASREVQSARDWKCFNCSKFDNGQCTLCTCYVPAKVVIASEKCPIGKWGRVKVKKHLTARSSR